MKRLFFLTIMLALLVVAYWAGVQRGRQNAGAHPAQGTRQVLYYVDPMNPAHTSDKPGKAPCGMDMEPVYADALGASGATAALASLPPGTIKVTPEKQQLIGVRVAPAEKKALRHDLRLLGKVATDETRIYRINATIDGWITRTMPVAAGSLVRKNETLAGFYSPEFLSAGQALLFALSSKDRIHKTGAAESARAV
jgi:Cu(I)/Ag(I) efflux system membrane fusion protein